MGQQSSGSLHHAMDASNDEKIARTDVEHKATAASRNKLVRGRGADFDTALFVKGSNKKKQLGLPQLAETAIFKRIEQLDRTRIVDVCCGKGSTVVLTANQTAWSFGDNMVGSCGQNYNAFMPVPRMIAKRGAVLNDVVQIAAGNSHGCLLTTQGKVYTFGKNSSSMLGKDDAYFYIPYDATRDFLTGKSTGEKFVCIGCGPTYVVLVTDKNYVYKTKSNIQQAAEENEKSPAQVTKVTCCEGHYALLRKDGIVYTSGSNSNGQLGHIGEDLRPLETSFRSRNVCVVENMTFLVTERGNLFFVGLHNGKKTLLPTLVNLAMSVPPVKNIVCNRFQGGFYFVTEDDRIYNQQYQEVTEDFVPSGITLMWSLDQLAFGANHRLVLWTRPFASYQRMLSTLHSGKFTDVVLKTCI